MSNAGKLSAKHGRPGQDYDDNWTVKGNALSFAFWFWLDATAFVINVKVKMSITSWNWKHITGKTK